MSDTPNPEMTPEDADIAQAAEYTLRLMTPEEERSFEARLASDRALEKNVAEWVFHFAPLSQEYAPKKAPKSVKTRLMVDLFGAPEKQPLLARLWPWKALTGIATACALVLGAMVLLQSQPQPQPGGGSPSEARPLFVSDITATDNSVQALAVYDSATGEMRVTRTAGAPASGRDFELWAIIGDASPRSLGVLNDDGTGSLVVSQDLLPQIGGAVLAISDEPDGGSPFAAPSGDVLATGEMREL